MNNTTPAPGILFLVEGAKTDFSLMKKLLDIYRISADYSIVSYNTNIYNLYERMFFENDPESLDLLQVMKEHEPDETKKRIFDRHFSDIILIFDLDPQDPLFSPEKIIKMASFFNESSDHGKLYLNYPMVESFYHMKRIPDPDYDSYVVSLDELKERTFKTRVKQVCRIPYKNFAVSRQECNTIIEQNLQKARNMIKSPDLDHSPDTIHILEAQLLSLEKYRLFSVLCTCIFYITDYNPHFLEDI